MDIVGIDEAGRGALAGPVVVAAVLITQGFKYPRRDLPKLKDSKKLSSRQRELWYAYLRGNKQVFFSSSRIYQGRIDRTNISKSANLGASRALEGVAKSARKSPKSLKILIDGGLYLGSHEHKQLRANTLIRGDERITAIKLASIVAKVTRDRYMRKLDERYPKYGLQRHKGYGTKDHFRALKKQGISEIHRLTYLTRYPNLKPRRSQNARTQKKT